MFCIARLRPLPQNKIIRILKKNGFQEVRSGRHITFKKTDSAGKVVLKSIINHTKKSKGDIYDKSIVLLKGIIQRHPFESGNRRTALVSTVAFLELNGKKINIVHDTNILQGIREGYYKDNEIKKWLKGGKIREFKR